MKNKIFKNKIFLFIFACLVSYLPGIIGSFFTINAIKSWYVYLEKPIFNPPNWIFSPVWTLLYFLIAISFYFILISKNKKSNFKKVLILFILHFILNASWSIIFFKLQFILLALINIILLCIIVFFLILETYKINKKSAYLLIPYLLWITFASYLNLSIFLLN
jgi:tryptophan-rich sensory protein